MNGIPDGQFMAMVKVGEKGQIVIPKEIRDMFNIEPGSTLLILADVTRGIALTKSDIIKDFTKDVMDGMK